ncbi:MAG TPA: hypothetical protein VNO33_03195 [Kofleriaceae bacterium]|nr:hypothetical protein [Kofleriaceae bacterium]
MLSKTTWLAAALSLCLVPMGCSQDRGNDRWATTENTNVAIDWNKVNEAYKAAEGPEDLEKRINEIYQGDETISISVRDVDEAGKTQEVTGFFDKNSSGNVDEGEKVFTIKREITGDGQGHMQTQGYGAYAGYHSPLLSIATGMLLGSMMSRAFMPGYAPMYSQPYRTSPSRLGQLREARANSPSRASRSKASSTGRGYNRTPRGSRGGGRFGVRRAVRTARPVHLTA